MLDEETQSYNLKTVCGEEEIDHGTQSMRANQGGIFKIHGQTEMSGELPITWEYHEENSVPGGEMSGKDNIWITIEQASSKEE